MFSSTVRENILLNENVSTWSVEHDFNQTVNLLIHSKFAGQSTTVPQACLRMD